LGGTQLQAARATVGNQVNAIDAWAMGKGCCDLFNSIASGVQKNHFCAWYDATYQTLGILNTEVNEHQRGVESWVVHGKHDYSCWGLPRNKLSNVCS
jgi:hypothetical protein